MLQELKTDNFRLTTALSSIALGFHQLIAFPQNGRAGTMLLIHPDFTISNSGEFLNSTTIWASIHGPIGTFNIASIYGPHTTTTRANLWAALKNHLPNGDWILGGDFNTTEGIDDSTMQASLLQG